MRLKRLSLQTLFASGLIAFSLAGHSVETARIEGFGPVARGLAGAGVAHNTGAAAIILNPAELLSQKPGHELMLQISEIHVNIDIRNLDTHEFARNSHQRNNRGPYDLPEIAYSYRAENWAFGIGAFAAAGFGTEYRDRTFLSRTSTGNVETGLDTTSRIFALKIPLALAWQATDTLKLGAAVDIVRVGLNVATLYDVQQIRMLSKQGRVSGGLAALTALPTLAGVHLDFVKEDPLDSELQAWGIGGRLGLSWQATAKTNLAISYDFETHIADLRGKGKLTAIDILNTQIQLNGSGRFQDLQLPASITAGFSHAFSSKFSLVGDIRRSFWKHMLGDAAFAFTAEGGLFDGQNLNVLIPLGFNHATTITLGAEWSPSPEWTLRSGLSRALQQLVKNENLSGTFPTITQNHLVVNSSYRWQKRHEFTAGMTFAWTKPIKNPGNTVGSTPAIEARNRQFTPSLGYRFQF